MSAADFSATPYFTQSVSDEERFKKSIFLNDTLFFSYNSVTYKDFKPKERSYLNRIQPLSIVRGVVFAIASVVRLAFELIAFAFNLICQVLNLNSLSHRFAEVKESVQHVKAPIFDTIRSVEGIIGNIVSLFHDKAGAYLEQDERFQKECYTVRERQKPFLRALRAKYEKIPLAKFDNKTVLADLKKYPKILGGAFIDDEQYQKLLSDEKAANALSITDLVKNSEEVTYALMSKNDLNQLKLSQLNSASMKSLTIIAAHKEKGTEAPKNLDNLRVCDLLALTNTQLETELANLPPVALNLLTDEQFASLNLPLLPEKKLNQFLKALKIKRLAEEQIFELAAKAANSEDQLELLASALKEEHFKNMTLSKEKIKHIEALFTASTFDSLTKMRLFNALKETELLNHTKDIPPSLLELLSPNRIHELDVSVLTREQTDALFPDGGAIEDFISEKTYSKVVIALATRNVTVWQSLTETQKNSIKNNLSDEIKQQLKIAIN